MDASSTTRMPSSGRRRRNGKCKLHYICILFVLAICLCHSSTVSPMQKFSRMLLTAFTFSLLIAGSTGAYAHGDGNCRTKASSRSCCATKAQHTSKVVDTTVQETAEASAAEAASTISAASTHRSCCAKGGEQHSEGTDKQSCCAKGQHSESKDKHSCCDHAEGTPSSESSTPQQ